MGKRTSEFVLGLLGGIFGFFASIFAMMVGGLSSALGGGSEIVYLGFSAMFFSILGIVGAAFVKSKTKLGSWIMIASAIGGLISISFAFLLSFVLLLIGGLMGLLRKSNN